ncbi:tRNA sulfurtransferase [Haloarchaeobius sp. FL176]|uniref:tRNA sulfurtransferase n=1 Tax=Haloarchaeobius sp. FL176 TaxID=2967129 RepID=UPI0021479404|nr:THUMP domain-containing protein [Haloarchaeobius sp. FL176]
MHPPGADAVLVRHGDLNVKSTRVKRRMEHRLLDHVESLLAADGIAAEVDRHWSRPIVRGVGGEADRAAETTARAFGVVSTSPAVTVPSDRGAVEDALAAAGRAVYTDGTFAVSVNRADKTLPYTSEDLERSGGQAIWEAVEDEFDPVVDLDDPDVVFEADLREDEAFVFCDRYDGPGGLPHGTQEPLVALVSGGIDSPVAAYEAMRRGSPVVPVYVELGEYGGADHEARAVETVRTLSARVPDESFDLWRVPAGDVVADLVDTMETGRMLAFRRFLLMVGEAVAEETGAVGVLTGEALGQKSSQTAQNMAVTSQAIDLPVHRPLFSWDKHDIVSQARAIDTFVDSTVPAGCNRVVPDQPETHGSAETIARAEPDDLRERARTAVERAGRLSF